MAQELFGLALSGDRDIHTIGWSIGATGSGKTVFMSTLEAAVGVENTARIHISDLKDGFPLMNAIGKRLVVFPDERFDGARYDGNAAIVSELITNSGGGNIRVKQKYSRNWEGKFHALMHINSNEVLRLRDESGALLRRIALLDFRKTVPPEKRDPDLSKKLEKELPGIFNWAMEGYRNLRARRHFIMPERSKEKLELVRTQFSRITSFVERCCLVGREHAVYLDDLYMAYLGDCEDKGVQVTDTKDTFSQKLSSAFPDIVSKRTHRNGKQVRKYAGIGLAKKR